ncbi:MAG: hypothetical protein CM15mV44_0230 [uncultured marine virus]|uniref:phage adaptor protein n=1 Tax=Hyphomonas sp. TaxID=87 RepID=UPI000C894EA7|nr:hypothetical protein [Hyphomonas sp.]MAL42798.1 hypothetical protein [Hyphomonas sp.]BCV01635.1 MAG: hypothetical protein CM15mV44_0230 [uncultured marine virus]
MATSNSTDFEPNVAEFIEEAYERCGLELRTGYDLKSARRSINLMLAEWANRGLNQWTISEATQTVTEGTREYTLDSSVIDILDVVLRRTEGSTTTDTQMSRVSRSEYINIPTKGTKARPNQYFLDKQNTPVLKIWPAPENSTDILVFNKMVRMDDADKATNTMDLPFRFYPCFVAGLAYYLSMKRNPQLTEQLKIIYEEEFRRAADEDGDRASFRINPSQS